jgi:penicillin-binding protein 1C
LIDEVVGWQGESARPPLVDGRQVLPTQAVWQVLDVLSDPQARMLSFGRGGPLEMPFDMAAKTGTSKGFRDNWALGVTTRYAVGVWVGNFDGTPMRDVSGVTGAAPLLRDVMLLLHGDHPPAPFERPEGLVRTAICPLSGHAWTLLCGASHTEWLRPDQVPGPCDWHAEARIDRRNGLLAGANCLENQVTLRHGFRPPGQYAEWAQGREGLLPARFSPLCPDPNTVQAPSRTTVRILQPVDGAVLVLDPHTHAADRQVALRAEVSDTAALLTWRVDGQVLAHGVSAASQTLWTPQLGEHSVVVEVARPSGAPIHARARVTVH